MPNPLSSLNQAEPACTNKYKQIKRHMLKIIADLLIMLYALIYHISPPSSGRRREEETHGDAS